MTGDVSGGATLILTMTLAQIAAAAPIARLGRQMSPTAFLRRLIAIRTAALVMMSVFATCGFAFVWLAVFAMIAGSVSGIAYGQLRMLLNAFTPTRALPRALGIAATLNEITFVLAPVAASALGGISPEFGLLCFALIGALPMLLIPRIARDPDSLVTTSARTFFSGPILLWLVCAGAGSASIAIVEIGAVGLAMRFGYEPAFAFFFTVPLCLASAAGGIWVSVRNQISSAKAVVFQLFVAASGTLLTSLQLSVTTTIAGAVLIGLVLAPLGTYYSLKLDKLAPPERRAEVFALLRTANALGIILASTALTMISLTGAMITVTLTTTAVAFMVAGLFLRRR
jgi:hypothetical protein